MMTQLPGFRDSSRWIWITLIITGALIGGAVVAYRPARNWNTVRRARQLAGEAQVAMDSRLLVVCSEKIKSASRFAPNDPAVLRVTARFLSLNRHAKALSYWEQLIAVGSATAADRQEFIRLALSSARPDVAQAELSDLLRLNPGDLKTQELALDLLVASGSWDKAEEGAATVLRQHPASKRALLIQGRARLRNASPEIIRLGLEQLRQFAAAPSEERIDALVDLASAEFLETSERLRNAEILSTVEGATLAERLSAIDVLWRLDPTRRHERVEQVPKLLSADHDDADLVAIANWMRTHGAAVEADGLLPAAGAAKSEPIFLARVELLASLGRWDEADELVTSGGKDFPPEATACARAALASARGETNRVVHHLQSALESAGTRWLRVSFIAGYALQMGHTNVALEAWNRLLDEPRFSFTAANGILRNLPDRSFADYERRAHRVLARLQPKDGEYQAENAYLDLLAGENVARSVEVFQRLIGTHADSPNLSVGLAFGRLRQNRVEDALGLIESQKMDWKAAEPHHRAIYAAILAANHQLRDARVLASGIDPKLLRPLEQKLIHDLVSNR